jgi:hypothetical protein
MTNFIGTTYRTANNWFDVIPISDYENIPINYLEIGAFYGANLLSVADTYCKHIDSKLYDMYKNYSKAVPIKVGFDWCSLGYKTKWTDTDFRFEWNPVFTFVFFGYQLALTVYSPYHDHYWTSWLYYEYATDKTKSKRERVEQCRKELNQTWTSHKHDEEPVTTDYYTKILKSKYLK